MARPRLPFQLILEDIVDEGGKVYFQPPETLRMIYPCIRYTTERIDGENADNATYYTSKGYNVIYISQDPDSIVPEKLRMLPMCRFVRYYTSDNLHHWVYTIYY